MIIKEVFISYPHNLLINTHWSVKHWLCFFWEPFIQFVKSIHLASQPLIHPSIRLATDPSMHPSSIYLSIYYEVETTNIVGNCQSWLVLIVQSNLSPGVWQNHLGTSLSTDNEVKVAHCEKSNSTLFRWQIESGCYLCVRFLVQTCVSAKGESKIIISG